MTQALTKELAQELFMAAKRAGPDVALRTSFRKYCIQRDQLMAEFSDITGYPESVFEDAIMREMAAELCKSSMAHLG